MYKRRILFCYSGIVHPVSWGFKVTVYLQVGYLKKPSGQSYYTIPKI